MKIRTETKITLDEEEIARAINCWLHEYSSHSPEGDVRVEFCDGLSAVENLTAFEIGELEEEEE